MPVDDIEDFFAHARRENPVEGADLLEEVGLGLDQNEEATEAPEEADSGESAHESFARFWAAILRRSD